MRIMSVLKTVNHAFTFVTRITKIFNIDESHALKHSMEVYNYANKIYKSECSSNPYLENQLEIICASAILHDMCDKKYMAENDGVMLIKNHMRNFMTEQHVSVVQDIITTMSYSKVKVNGFPNLGEYQLAYHIVREADLLTSYDIDRCIIFGMYKENLDYEHSLKRSIDLFNNRVLKYRDDNLFVTEYSKRVSKKLHKKALEDISILTGVL